MDEGFETGLYYADDDEDGYGDPDASATLCLVSSTWVSDSTDCAPRDEARNPGVAEDCADGKDDDCDGLLDCEDTDCEGADGCQETDCDDYRDNDDDGDCDCDDDECWGTADCPGLIVSRVTRTGHVWRSTDQSSAFERSSCDGDLTTWARAQDCTVWGAEEVLGSARLLTPDGGSARCSWGLDEATVRRCAGWERRDGVVESHSTSSSGRVGFWVSSGCPVAGSAFLPALSTLTDRWGPWYDGDSSRLRTDFDATGDAVTTCTYSRFTATDTWWYNTSVSSGERFVRTTGTYDFGSGASD